MLHLPTRPLVPVLALVALLTGCGSRLPGGSSLDIGSTTGGGSSTGSTTGGREGDNGPTYYADAKPIIDAKCSGCHSAGNIAPFTLTSFDEATAHLAGISDAVGNGTMPPWSAGPNCNSYKYATNLTDAERATLMAWTAAGGPEGDASTASSAAPLSVGTMPRVDQTLKMKAPYRIQKTPDEYRCFILDWPTATTKYVTGFRVHADQKSVVHHAIIMIAKPSEVATITAKDGADGKPGYDCYGTFGVTSVIPNWLGFWAPGNNGVVFSEDEHTGLPIPTGSKIVMQMHYHWETDPTTAPADQSSLDIMWKDSVAKPGAVMPALKVTWFLAPQTMKIAAGDANATQDSGATPLSIMWGLFAGGQPAASSYTIYSAGLHMHVRGKSGNLKATVGGKDQCLVDIPKWNFHWQDSYVLQQPVTLKASDSLDVRCSWDNSAAGQPIVNGQKAPVQPITWGEGTNDEMCLGIIYVAPT